MPASAITDFIADLHLSPRTPEINQRFLHYLDGQAHQAGQLFILGDLFEAWPGDDAIDDPDDGGFAAAIVAALRRRLSGIAMPTYIVEIPGGDGKIPVGELTSTQEAELRASGIY